MKMKRLWLAWFVCLVAAPPQAQAQLAPVQQQQPKGAAERGVPYDSRSLSIGATVATNAPDGVTPAEANGAVECTIRYGAFQGKGYPVWLNAVGEPVLNDAGNAFPAFDHQRHLGFRVEVYDTKNAAEPITTWATKPFDLPRGVPVDEMGNPVDPGDPEYAGLLLRDSVNVSIPMPPREKPYFVKVQWFTGPPKPVEHKDERGRVYGHDRYTHQAGTFRAKVN
jgi:hypothetical protein